MYEHFTEKAIIAIMLGQEESRRMRQNYLGTEHILLGLISKATGIAQDINLKDAQIELEKIISCDSEVFDAEVFDIPFTPRAKEVVRLSGEESKQLGHDYICTGHLLLSLIRDEESEAMKVLKNLGVDTSEVRTQVIQMLGETNGEKNSIVMQIMENQGVDISQVHARINEIVSETVEVEVDISQNDTNTPQNVEVEVDISQNDTNTPQNVEVEVDISQNDTNTPQNNDTNDSKSKIPKNPYSPSPRQILITRLILLLVVVMLIGYWFYGWWNRPKTINLTTFLQLVKAEEVAHIEVKDNLVTATKDNGEKVKTYIEPNMGIYQQLKSADIEVDNSQVSIQVRPSGTFRSLLLNVIQWVIIIVLVIILAVPLYRLYFLFDQKENNIDKFRKNPAKKTGENQPKVSFDDIGGAAQAKEELKTIIEFIRNPEYFQGLGARMPKGIILEGPPGTGKTLLARAVASESSANFFYMSASEFVELYVGVGASRVRDLFNEAKKNLPAIIYIDELDAVGQRRNLLLSGGDEERSNTLNQLLTELDGFESYQGIFVMGSTNRVDILDVALLRPGRFDKRVIVDIPSFEERCQILEIHLKNKKIADNVNIEDIARYTIDFNGAELANIVNQAAILATKNKCDSIDKHLLEEATKAQGAIIPSVVNVQEFKEDISKEIVGQYVALTAIGWSVCSHYANIRSRSESGVSYGHKPNLFLYGPPGSGKTTIIKATANSLEVPFVKKPATGLVKDKTYMQTILNQLLRAANNDIRRAECGIVWLYGMEEITFDDFKFFQEELARAIEGEKFDLAEDFFAKNSQSIHTQNILFICELTVDGKSRSRKSVFKKKSDDTGESKTDNEILVDLGLVTRLINQFPIIASTEILKQEELLEILTYGESSPVSQFTHHYEKLGIEVELEKSALDIVAKECLKRGGDARLLDSLLNDVKKYLGDWVSEKKVTVTALMVENALTRPVSQKKTSNSNDSRGKIATTSEEVEKSSSEVDIDAQYNFFIEVLELTGESEGDSETVYPLLKQNIDLLNDNLIPILQTWAEQAFSQVEVFLIEDVGRVILKFSNLIMQFPLGNKASNMEIAIAGYKEVLKVFTRESNQKNWATTQNNLGIAYNYRIRGDKAENIEQAIAAIQQALSVDTKEDFPYEWARDQNNLGNAYIFRICGNKAENIEQAIAVFEQVLSVVTKEDFPYDWARDQNNLGNAYILRICGNKAENIEQAIAAFEQALSVDTKEDFPYDWATTQNNLGFAYSERIRGDKAKNLEQAIATFKQISSVYTESDFPYEWARTQNNLGSVYSERIRGDKAKNLEQAIATFKQISSVYTKSDFPYDWARTQNNLGSVYKDRIYGKKAENIEQAITAFEQALSVHTKSDFPYDWATTQNGLGNAYRDRIRGDKAENIELAITTFEQALSVYTKSDFPYDWATTQNNLGNAYSNRIRGDKAENIELAITAFEQALSVYTKSDFPYDWATTQNGLGNAYSNRIRGDKAENIEKAIATFEQALSVCTKPDFPYDWAITQNNLGNAYIEGIHGDKAENIEQAITAFKQALSVYTKSDFPYEWATTQNNLGLAYSNRIRGDKAENIEKAITTFEQVLSVYTKSDFPYELDFGQKENS